MIKVLFVDDDANVRKLMEFALQKAGFSVITARNGKEGLELAEQDSPDVAILDVMMPGLHGYELCRQLRANSATKQIKIIFLTARAQSIDEQAGLEAGADRFLAKPVMPNELVQEIQDLVGPSQVLPPAEEPTPAPPAEQEAPTEEKPAVSAPLKSGGHLVACFSLAPQVGVTALSINLALAFALSRRAETPLVELHHTPAGTLHALGLESNPLQGDFSLKEGTLEWNTLASHLVKHAAGVYALPVPPAEAHIPPEWTLKAVTLLKQKFPLSVADVSSKPGTDMRAWLSLIDLVLLIMTPEVASIRSALRALQGLQTLQFPDSNVLLVVNNIHPQAQVPVAKIQEGIKRPIFASIPYSASMSDALRARKPLVLIQPRSPTSQAIGTVAVRIAKGLHQS